MGVGRYGDAVYSAVCTDGRTSSGGFVVRIVKVVIIAVFVSAGISGAYGGQNAFADLAEYYGFGEIEIVKLDWGIMGVQVADFNGDGRNDIAIVNNQKARIELLIQKEGNKEPSRDREQKAHEPDHIVAQGHHKVWIGLQLDVVGHSDELLRR